MAGRGGVIKKRLKDGSFSYAIKYQLPDGRQKWETVGRNKKEADRVLSERIHALYSGTYQELKETTFAELAGRWLAYTEPRVKPSTFDGYRRYFENHWLPAFGNSPLRLVTAGRIQEAVAGLQAQGLSPKSVNNFLVPLKKMLSDAVAWGYLGVNPAASIARSRVVAQEMQALTPAQVRELLAAAHDGDWLILATAVLTGLRRGELLGLQWGDVLWSERRLRVSRAVWRGEFVTPKSQRSVRTVDLAPVLFDGLKAARPVGRPESYAARLLFPAADGRPLDPDNFVKRRFLPTLKRAGLPRIRFHDLRHTYASLLIMAGEHPKYAQAQLGHASIQTTLDRYGHLLAGAYTHGGTRLGATVFGESEGSS